MTTRTITVEALAAALPHNLVAYGKHVEADELAAFIFAAITAEPADESTLADDEDSMREWARQAADAQEVADEVLETGHGTADLRGKPDRGSTRYPVVAALAPTLDAQTADLLAALAERDIHSRGDLVLLDVAAILAAMLAEPASRVPVTIDEAYDWPDENGPAEPAGIVPPGIDPETGMRWSRDRDPFIAAEPAGATGLREALEDRPHEHEWVEVTTLGDKQRRWICSSSELAGCRAERREVAATPAGAGLREATENLRQYGNALERQVANALLSQSNMGSPATARRHDGDASPEKPTPGQPQGTGEAASDLDEGTSARAKPPGRSPDYATPVGEATDA